MAGFMAILNGYAFPGECKAHADLVNGQLVMASKHVTVATAADTTTTFTVMESDILLGDEAKKGIRVRVDAITAGKNYYLVENAEPRYELNFAPTYNLDEQKTAQGAYVRMHMLQVGEEFVTNLWDGTTIPAVDATVSIKADGKIG